MALTASRTPRPSNTTLISECVNCGVDKAVHVLDGCTHPEFQTVRVCKGCFERPDLCTC